MRIALVLVAALFATSCSKQSPAPTGPTPGQSHAEQPAEGKKKPLFDRLGGLPAITAVVDEFLNNVLADDRINQRFAADVTDPEAAKHFRQMLIDQICAATGGPCEYKGKNMVEAHAGMKITEDEFNWLVEDLVKALDKLGVKEAEKTELLTALGGMKDDIVGH